MTTIIDLDNEAPPHQPANSSAIESALVASYEMRGVRWLWPNRFALGKIALIGGLPDRGKGLIAADMIARVTKGRRWPCEEGQATCYC
jgi:hypothetical protein